VLRLVFLLDASGSMNLYTAFFVRFLHGVVDAFRESEAFVFHTRLAHVSASLRDRDVSRAVDKLSLMAQGIGGGTKIGESLATFNRWHAKRVINSRTAVMIVSDGYDTGAPEMLGEEMRRLRRRCRRIVWLNPLIGWRGYSPQARGMQAALPYVDLFAPAHNIESLAALEPYLARILLYGSCFRHSPHPLGPQGGGRAVRARNCRAYGGGDRGKGRGKGRDSPGWHDFRRMDWRRLRPRGGSQSGQGRSCRRQIASCFRAAARLTRPARTHGRGGARRRPLCQQYVPERRHDGHIRGAGSAAVSNYHLRIEPGCRRHCRFCQTSRIQRHGQRTSRRASSIWPHPPPYRGICL